MSAFEWNEEYSAVLEKIAKEDVVETDWSLLRDIIKHRLDKNIEQYLSNPPKDDTAQVLAASRGPPRSLANGGLKLPPFAPRIRLEGNPNEAPKHVLSKEEAGDFKTEICKLLDGLEGAPFTIQRVCELLLHPQRHYKYIGKYLRAVEKTLLVTSTWDAFPAGVQGTSASSVGPSIVSTSALSTPSTPMFSPIPFLHDDARSHSKSPPPSPLALAAVENGGTSTTTPHAGAEVSETRALGLVDELDDPGPGHLSKEVHPISSVTSIEQKPPTSLAERFVKSTTEAGESSREATSSNEGEKMQIDEDSEDKENKAG
ncbi:PPP4R2-domain-containing protein [Panus rudis PR-1116 ss-1]|nr:PPP4R2-domain-containing protein [Panus rudis PR-1116 ss-1]